MALYSVAYVCLACYTPQHQFPPTRDVDVCSLVMSNLSRWSQVFKKTPTEVGRNALYRETTFSCPLTSVLDMYNESRVEYTTTTIGNVERRDVESAISSSSDWTRFSSTQMANILTMAQEATRARNFKLTVAMRSPSCISYCANSTLNLDGSFFVYMCPISVVRGGGRGTQAGPTTEDVVYQTWKSWMNGRYASDIWDLASIARTWPMTPIWCRENCSPSNIENRKKQPQSQTKNCLAADGDVNDIFGDTIFVPKRLNFPTSEKSVEYDKDASDIALAFEALASYALDTVNVSKEARKTKLPLEILASPLGRNFCSGDSIDHGMKKLLIDIGGDVAIGRFSLSELVLRQDESSSTPNASILGGAHFDVIQDVVAREGEWSRNNANIIDIAVATATGDLSFVPFVGWITIDQSLGGSSEASISKYLYKFGILQPPRVNIRMSKAGQSSKNPPTRTLDKRHAVATSPSGSNHPYYARQGRLASINATFATTLVLPEDTLLSRIDEDLIRRSVVKTVFGANLHHRDLVRGGISSVFLNNNTTVRVQSIVAAEKKDDQLHTVDLTTDSLGPRASSSTAMVVTQTSPPHSQQKREAINVSTTRRTFVGTNLTGDVDGSLQQVSVTTRSSLQTRYDAGDFVRSAMKRNLEFKPKSWWYLSSSLSTLANISTTIQMDELEAYWRNIFLHLPTKRYSRSDVELELNALRILVNIIRQSQTINPIGGVGFVYPTMLLDIAATVSVNWSRRLSSSASLRQSVICKSLLSSQYRGGNATHSGFPVELPFVVISLGISLERIVKVVESMRSTAGKPLPPIHRYMSQSLLLPGHLDVLPVTIFSIQTRTSFMIEDTRVTICKSTLDEQSIQVFQSIIDSICISFNDHTRTSPKDRIYVTLFPGMSLDAHSSLSFGKISAFGDEESLRLAGEFGPARAMKVGQRIDASIATILERKRSSSSDYKTGSWWIAEECRGMNHIVPVYSNIPLSRRSFEPSPDVDTTFDNNNALVVGIVQSIQASHTHSKPLSDYLENWRIVATPPTSLDRNTILTIPSSILSYYQALSVTTNIIGALAYLNTRGMCASIDSPSQILVTRQCRGLLNDLVAIKMTPDFESINQKSVRNLVEMMSPFLTPTLWPNGGGLSFPDIVIQKCHDEGPKMTQSSLYVLKNTMRQVGIHDSCLMVGLVDHRFAQLMYDSVISVLTNWDVAEGTDALMAIYTRASIARIQSMNACHLPWNNL